MFTRGARMIGLSGLLVLLVGGGIGVWSTVSSHVDAADSKESKVTSLLKERHATLKEIATVVQLQRDEGRASFDQVHTANQAVNGAELDLCDSDEARLAVLEKMLADSITFEKYLKAAHDSGVGTATAALKAKADRLKVEISLERAKAT